MELLYIWINKDKKNLFNNREFSFTEEYFVHFDNEKRALTISKNNDFFNIFRNGVISNVSAIVGENGTGKTSLLEHIRDVKGKSENIYDETIEVFWDNRDKRIKIYTNTTFSVCNSNGIDLETYHDKKATVTKIFLTNSYYCSLSDNNTLSSIDLNIKNLNQISSSFYKKVCDYPRKPTERSRNHSYSQIDIFDELMTYHYEAEDNTKHFQSICDLIYYHDLFKHGIGDFLSKNQLNITISFKPYNYNEFTYYQAIGIETFAKELSEILSIHNNLNILTRSIIDEILYIHAYTFLEKTNHNYLYVLFLMKDFILSKMKALCLSEIQLVMVMIYITNNNNYIDIFDEFKKAIEESLINTIKYLDIRNDITELDIDDILINYEQELEAICKYSLTIFEYILYETQEGSIDINESINNEFFQNFAEKFDVLENYEKLRSIIIQQIENYNDRYDFAYKENILPNLINLLNNPSDSRIYAYYESAFNELEEYSEIIGNNSKITISKNHKTGNKFLEFINNLAKNDDEKPQSFILRYLDIDGLTMSSGERALLNFFSWINLIPFFGKLCPKLINSTEKNIILLIDEIDLYCHPEWQRKFIKYMIDELTKQFNGYRVQIIFSTHSPIVLSDIPHENIIYLGQGKRQSPQSQSFGQNIHTLLKDGFFIESTIGEFAKSRIQNTNDDLDVYICNEKALSNKKYKEYKQIIDIVGEPIIKNHLNEKLNLVTSKELKIIELEKELEKLKGDKND